MNIHKLYRPFLKHFRTKRMRQFWLLLQVKPETRVLDVGGDPFNWSLLDEKPQLTFLNVYRIGAQVTRVIADGRAQPFKDKAFDLVYSNSVIEHLGSFDNQKLFAAECVRVGRCYYVQTPYKRFPVEPHLITPFIHWLPRALQRRLLRNFTVWGLVTRPTEQQCEALLQEIYLLDEQQLKQLFPTATIWRERLLGLTKSLIAVRTE